jgi:heme/copper-type cytochrome/quinol oxidase subunit 2
LCGLGHYRMRGFLTIMNQADYQSFLAEEGERLAAD